MIIISKSKEKRDSRTGATIVPGAAGTLKNPVSTGAGADIAAKPMKVFYSSITGTVLREDPTAAVR